MERGALRMSGLASGGGVVLGKGILPELSKFPRQVNTNGGSSSRGRTQNFQIRAVSTEPSTRGLRARREQNVEGEFYVDRTCIDCDTCRWMAPETFRRDGEQSAVYNQPSTPESRLRSLQALVSCPTGSIRTVTPAKDVVQAQETFPLPIHDELPGVFHCGFHSEKSFAATSYFIQRQDGNILVDSPRYTERLAKRLDQLGGVKYMFLTHKDDIADHKRWQKRFDCERIIHTLEIVPGTEDVEVKLEGTGPWNLGDDVELIFTPGHTRGHVCLFLKDRKVMFAGDHVSASTHYELEMTTDYNWFSVEKQVESLEALIPFDFTWVLPGHGRRKSFKDVDEKNAAIRKILSKFRGSGRYN
ncbi:hypothetical protein R1sor_006301 [Riccia sorocarpa]|uniref:Metallo-beta-lactamase domain-containing protein n=1 Tax=Riccia sorocarpa TaxID=122646 RepID=A0ABD3HQV7_9MARC